MKQVTIDCDFGGSKRPITFYIGHPAPTSHPIEFQNRWLAKERGGSVTSEVLESLSKLQ
jgi:hypothetical protein